MSDAEINITRKKGNELKYYV